jgi:hypothetical protein
VHKSLPAELARVRPLPRVPLHGMRVQVPLAVETLAAVGTGKRLQRRVDSNVLGQVPL